MLRALARHLALVAGLTGALATLAPALLVWSRRSRIPYAGEWFAAYLVEMMLLAGLVLLGEVARARIASLLAWTAAGVVAVVVAAVGFTIGGLFLPAAILLALSGLLADLERPRRLRHHVLVALAAAAAQAGFMWTAG